MAKRAMSGSEVYAHCRNRHEQKHLRDKLENLSEEESTSMDGLKLDINKWRQFRRNNVKISGWSPKAIRPSRRDTALLSNATSPEGYLLPVPGSAKGSSKQSPPLPWILTYGLATHNRVYNELLMISSKNIRKTSNSNHRLCKSAKSLPASAKLSTTPSNSGSSISHRKSLNEDKITGRKTETLKEAWLSPSDPSFYRSGDQCPPNTPKTLPIAKNTSATNITNEYYSGCSDVVTQVEMNERTITGKHNSSPKDFKEFCENTSVKNLQNACLVPGEKSERTEFFLCGQCRGRRKINEGDGLQSPRYLANCKRNKVVDTSIQVETHRSYKEDEASSRDTRRLCFCPTDPAQMQDIKNNETEIFYLKRKEERARTGNSSLSAPNRRIQGRHSQTDDSEDILASSISLFSEPSSVSFAVPQESHQRQSFEGLHKRPTITDQKYVKEPAVDGQNSENDALITIQPLPGFACNKSKLASSLIRKVGRDESLNHVHMQALRTYRNAETFRNAERLRSRSEASMDESYNGVNMNKEIRFKRSSHYTRMPSLRRGRTVTVVQNNEGGGNGSIFKRKNTSNDLAKLDTDESPLAVNSNRNSDNGEFCHTASDDCIDRGQSKTGRPVIAKNHDSRSTIRRNNRAPSNARPRMFSNSTSGFNNAARIIKKKSFGNRSRRHTAPGKSELLENSPTLSDITLNDQRCSSSKNILNNKDSLIENDIRIPTAGFEDAASDIHCVEIPTSRELTEISFAEENPKCGEVLKSIEVKTHAESDQNKNNYCLHINGRNRKTGSKKAIISSSKGSKQLYNKSLINDNFDNSIPNDDVNNNQDTNGKSQDQNPTINTQQIGNNSGEILKKETSESDDTPEDSRNDDVYHKGILLSNYVSPDQRYKMVFPRPNTRQNPSAGSRSHSFNGRPGESDPHNLVIRLNFSKQSRQRALVKLIENNSSDRSNSIQKALTESLQARIKEFCISLQPYVQSTSP